MTRKKACITHHFNACACIQADIKTLALIVLSEHEGVKQFVSGFRPAEPCICTACEAARSLLVRARGSKTDYGGITMNKYKKELLDLKAFIYNNIPNRTVEDVDKSIYELVLMLAGLRKSLGDPTENIAHKEQGGGGRHTKAGNPLEEV